ncbi:MAG: hypothetical protein HN750_17580 [Gemmatimonadales bacterium]|jgi:hypothetical protein|nr:hypothetical protein [Gemmatimonadales bacterium]
MKLSAFLERIPESFAIEVLEALPGPDRKDLVRRHGAKVKIGAGTLKRSSRIAKETRLLLQALRKSEDLDAKRTFLQGWLARRAEMVVAFLNAWEVEHTNGIVDSFDWVTEITAETVTASLETIKEKCENLAPIAPLVYFAYLELPVSEEVLDVDALWKSVEDPAPAT